MPSPVPSLVPVQLVELSGAGLDYVRLIVLAVVTGLCLVAFGVGVLVVVLGARR